MCLERLAAWQRPAWVVTGKSHPAGRGKRIVSTPVALSAAELALDLIETDEASVHLQSVSSISPTDFDVVIDFGQIIKGRILRENEYPGCLNIHPSYLPKYRGAAPIQRALFDGCDTIGISIFKLARSVDSGPLLSQSSLQASGKTYGELLCEAAIKGTDDLIKLVDSTHFSSWQYTAQDDSSASYAPKISPLEERIDWSRPAVEICRMIRALSPRPGAWTMFKGKRLKILDAKPDESKLDCGSPVGRLSVMGQAVSISAVAGSVILKTVQPEGKRPMSASAWRNGAKIGSEDDVI